MTPVIATMLVSIVLFIGGIIMAIIGYFLKQLVEQLKELNKTVSALQSELGVLVNDHDNLKEDVKDIDVRLKKFELA